MSQYDDAGSAFTPPRFWSVVAIAPAHRAQSFGMVSEAGRPKSAWNSLFSGIEPVTWTFTELPGCAPAFSVTEPALVILAEAIAIHPTMKSCWARMTPFLLIVSLMTVMPALLEMKSALMQGLAVFRSKKIEAEFWTALGPSNEFSCGPLYAKICMLTSSPQKKPPLVCNVGAPVRPSSS